MELEHVVKKGDPSGVGQQRPIGTKGSTGPRGAKGLLGVAGIQGPYGMKGPVGPAGPKGVQGGQGTRGDRRPIGMGGDTGSQGAAGKIGPKGDKGDRVAPAVEIDIVFELCKHLPTARVEQYRRGAYARYAINSMEDTELNDAARVKTIIDKGGRCKSDVTSQ